ncbi:MAG: PD-(D/E)XK nuclease family protein, partial [Nitrospiraceae bacterium]|nr:PD-(D/E)XK nuclease family protein [Nitrospiraceae bacterium]
MKPFAWSYSALTRFESCPKQYWHLNVEKDFKDVGSEFSAEGTLIHDALHKRVIKGQPLPIEMRHFETMAKRFAETPGEKKGEMKLALNRKMEPVDYFAHDVYLRVIIDLLVVRNDWALLVDWKTGKVKDDFTQMGLCAAVLSRWMPELKKIQTAYWLGEAQDIS